MAFKMVWEGVFFFGKWLIISYVVCIFQGWISPKMGSTLLVAMFIALQFATGMANPEAKRLYDDLLSNYNRLIRPVGNVSDRLTVKMGLRLSQLIDVVSTPFIHTYCTLYIACFNVCECYTSWTRKVYTGNFSLCLFFASVKLMDLKDQKHAFEKCCSRVYGGKAQVKAGCGVTLRISTTTTTTK